MTLAHIILIALLITGVACVEKSPSDAGDTHEQGQVTDPSEGDTGSGAPDTTLSDTPESAVEESELAESFDTMAPIEVISAVTPAVVAAGRAATVTEISMQLAMLAERCNQLVDINVTNYCHLEGGFDQEEWPQLAEDVRWAYEETRRMIEEINNDILPSQEEWESIQRLLRVALRLNVDNIVEIQNAKKRLLGFDLSMVVANLDGTDLIERPRLPDQTDIVKQGSLELVDNSDNKGKRCLEATDHQDQLVVGPCYQVSAQYWTLDLMGRLCNGDGCVIYNESGGYMSLSNKGYDSVTVKGAVGGEQRLTLAGAYLGAEGNGYFKMAVDSLVSQWQWGDNSESVDSVHDILWEIDEFLNSCPNCSLIRNQDPLKELNNIIWQTAGNVTQEHIDNLRYKPLFVGDISVGGDGRCLLAPEGGVAKVGNKDECSDPRRLPLKIYADGRIKVHHKQGDTEDYCLMRSQDTSTLRRRAPNKRYQLQVKRCSAGSEAQEVFTLKPGDNDEGIHLKLGNLVMHENATGVYMSVPTADGVSPLVGDLKSREFNWCDDRDEAGCFFERSDVRRLSLGAGGMQSAAEGLCDDYEGSVLQKWWRVNGTGNKRIYALCQQPAANEGN